MKPQRIDRRPITLQRLPSTGEYSVVALTLAAGANETSAGDTPSGDWVGAAQRGDLLRVTLADLEGKGNGAAAYHEYLAQQLNNATVFPPAEWLQHVHASWPGPRFASLALADVDTNQHRFAVALAGHPPPILRDPGGTVHSLSAPNFGLLGVGLFVDTPVLPDHPFPPGAWLILVSDGVLEAGVSRGEQFGRQRLLEAVATARSPVGALRIIYRAVSRHLRGAPLEDDLAAVIISRSLVSAAALARNGSQSERWATLLLCGQSGDEGARNQFAREATPWLFSHALRMLHNHADASDAVQNTLLRHLNYPYNPDFGATPQTWLVLLLRCAVANLKQWRGRGRWVDLPDDSEVPDLQSDPIQAVQGKEDMERLLQAVSRLKPELREAFTVRCLEQASYRKAAEILGLPLGTVASRVTRACQQLRAQLQQPIPRVV